MDDALDETGVDHVDDDLIVEAPSRKRSKCETLDQIGGFYDKIKKKENIKNTRKKKAKAGD